MADSASYDIVKLRILSINDFVWHVNGTERIHGLSRSRS